MKNHFNISDSINIRNVDIAGVACTQKNSWRILKLYPIVTFNKLYSGFNMHLLVLSICNCSECQINFMLHWLQYSNAPNVLTLYYETYQSLKLGLIPLFLLVLLSQCLPNHCNVCCNTLTPTVLLLRKVLQRNHCGSGKGWSSVYTLAKLLWHMLVLLTFNGVTDQPMVKISAPWRCVLQQNHDWYTCCHPLNWFRLCLINRSQQMWIKVMTHYSQTIPRCIRVIGSSRFCQKTKREIILTWNHYSGMCSM